MTVNSLIRLFVVLMVMPLAAVAQLTIVPIEKNPSVSDLRTSRTSQLSAMPLPFWDDFSFTQQQGVVNDTLWEAGKRVWVNDGLGIDPPSVMVATFDGLDSIGKPYSVTDLLAKGFADRMVSRKIRLGDVAEADRNTVFFSFYYQIKGRGELPDQDDNLSLWFLRSDGTWVRVFETGNTGNPATNKFNYVSLAVSDPVFFHNDFRFRFQNFARLSGPYDMWHVDYVYLNKGRTTGERSMPDRTVSTNLTPFFSTYTSVPLVHYRDTFPGISVKPEIRLFGLLENNFQPFRYTTRATVTQRTTSGIAVEKIVIADDVPPIDPQTGGAVIIRPFEILKLTLQQPFPGERINADADSVHVKVTFGLNSADDNPLVYLPKYRPINFLRNDTVSAEFFLTDFYARDDGKAEFGAGLNEAGTQLAAGFDLLKQGSDTLVAVDIYFPQFGDQSNQSLSLRIWDSKGLGPDNQLHQQSITVTRTEQNRFTRYALTQPVAVRGRFFVGWKQNATAVIPAGFDKNNDSGGTIYFNTTGEWVKNTQASGSLMVRPVFGEGNGVTDVTALPVERKSLPWPNPNSGSFRLPGGVTGIQITGAAGDHQGFRQTDDGGSTLIELVDSAPGMRIIRWQERGVVHTARLIIGRY
ncbi:MAG: hypothetical protein ACKOAR_08435 [Bacteroidota bacterium]